MEVNFDYMGLRTEPDAIGAVRRLRLVNVLREQSHPERRLRRAATARQPPPLPVDLLHHNLGGFSADVEGSGMAPTTSPSGRVLVVDDDPDIAEFLVQLLSNSGSQVTISRNGLDALDAVAIEPPDLVLLDLGLPGLNGLEVCRKLKADPITRLVPILILTGSEPGDGRVGA